MNTIEYTPISSVEFDVLSAFEQRKAIAADVIARVETRQYRASSGTFVFFRNGTSVVPTPDLADVKCQTVRDLMIAYQPDSCAVCGLGAILLSQVNVNGDCSLSEILTTRYYSQCAVTITPFVQSKNDLSPYIQRYFSKEQLQLIEIAFEQGMGAFRCLEGVHHWRNGAGVSRFLMDVEICGLCVTLEQADAAMKFGERREDSEGRLLSIMEAIIDHPEGLFDPLVAL